jgi:hypothetical protein
MPIIFGSGLTHIFAATATSCFQSGAARLCFQAGYGPRRQGSPNYNKAPRPSSGRPRPQPSCARSSVAKEVLSRSRVRGERGRVQVRRRPTVSALSGPVSIRRVDHHAFLAPPHRTERAVLPHSALGRVSHPGMRRRPIAKAPELKHAEVPKHDVIAKALRPSRRDLVPPP